MPLRFVRPRGDVNPAEGPWPGSHRGGICPDCRADVLNPQSRHFRDPFHNCRECGPGASITRAFPFVRENTSYAEFDLCPDCQAEQQDSARRQSGSPATSCPECGPQYWIEPTPPMSGKGDLIYEVSRLLLAGQILALKDQRAFRLLARADDDALLKRLHRRQEWRGAPVGLMVRDLEMASRIAELDSVSCEQLQAVTSPRVIVRLRDDAPVARTLIELGEVELMLAPEAVYEILFHDLGSDVDIPLLAIPAQVGVDAPVRENEEARRILRDVADSLVLHDLVLFPCTEDWVLRVVDKDPVVLRRSGADSDCPLPLPENAVQVLALGCGREATAAAAFGRCIRLGPFVGELDTDRAVEQFTRSAGRLLDLFGGEPEFVAYDPAARARFAPALESIAARPVAVDHHHAHVAAVMAEHGIFGPVIGLSLDAPMPRIHPEMSRGVILSGTAADTRQLESLPAFRIPGARSDGRDFWRTALGMIHDLLGERTAREWLELRGEPEDTTRSTFSMLEHGVDCTRIQSFGRTVCGLYEIIEAACQVPATRVCSLGRLAGPVRDIEAASLPSRSLQRDTLLGGIIVEILRRGRERRSARDTAAWAFTALVRGLAFRAADLARAEDIDTVVAGGGSLAEPWVRHVLSTTLEEEGLALYMSRKMPCGDAGIALGQVWSVVARGV